MKINHLILTAFLLIGSTHSAFTQKTKYSSGSILVDLKPGNQQYKDYSTYDVAVISAMDPNSPLNFEQPYEIHQRSLQKATGNADFHVISTVYQFFALITSRNTMSLKVNMSTKLFDKYGIQVHNRGLSREAFIINLDRTLSDDDKKNKDLIVRLAMQSAMDTLLTPFFNSMNASSKTMPLTLSYLNDVKDKPELKGIEDQTKEIIKAVNKDNGSAATFKATAEKYLPVWEAAAAYTGDEAEEVKRTAYQNLATFYTFTGEPEKARKYIALYKPIDKTISEMFGLLKYKQSENIEGSINELYPAVASNTASSTTIVSLKELIDGEKYFMADGVIVLKGKKNAGTYTGNIKISKLPAGTPGGIVNLDAPTDQILLETKDETGAAKKIGGSFSDIESIKANNGDMYTYQAFDQVMGMGGQGCFMKSTFKSPVITLYRTVLPDDRPNDYYIVKASDPKGLKSSQLKAWKKLTEFLSDCPDLETKMKDEVISKDEKTEVIVEMYSKCKQ